MSKQELSNESKISKEKMDEYRNSYILMTGSEEGFDENVIYENADLLLEMANATGKNARQIVDKYFDKIEWINRNGVVSLSIYPSSLFMSFTQNTLYYAAISESWGIIQRNYSSNSKWKNTKSMEMQYRCHAMYAQFKTPWNIEPHRTETNFNKVVAAGCNP